MAALTQNPSSVPATLSVAERSRLTAQRTLALRRQDLDEVASIDAQLAEAAAGAGADAGGRDREEGEDRLARVNERNRKANMESVRRAEMAEAERKRRERRAQQNGGGSGTSTPKVFDPSARLRTVPRLFETATPTSRCVVPRFILARAVADATQAVDTESCGASEDGDAAGRRPPVPAEAAEWREDVRGGDHRVD